MPSKVGLPPLECCRGTRPIQAASSRPLLKLLTSEMEATKALAVIGPMPGIFASLRLGSLRSCQSTICSSSSRAWRSSSLRCARSRSISRQNGAGSSFPAACSSFGTCFDIRDAPGHHQAELRQQAADLAGLRRARSHKTLAHAVQGQSRLLLDTLDRHKAHVRAAYCLADRLGIGGIGLVRLYVGLHEVRRDQAHRVPIALERSPPEVRTRAGLHTNEARR